MNEAPPEQQETSAARSLPRVIKLALLIFALLLGGITTAAIFVGEESNLAFDYEGFD